MVKEKKLLSYILGWFIVGFIIIFMGVNNVFAASYNADNFTAQIYDNINGSLTAKTTTKESSGAIYYYSYDVGYTAYSSGGAWGVSSPIPLLANHTYSMTVDPMVIGCGFTILSSINRIGVGTSLGNAVISYQNNTNVNEKLSQAVSNSRYLQYVFTPTINASYIVFPYSTTSSCSGRESQLTSIVIEDLGETGVSQDQINTSLNNQTNELNNSIQNSTDIVIGEINEIEQSIVESNKETQEVIKDQFNDCRDSYNLFDINKAYSYGSETNSSVTGNSLTINGKWFAYQIYNLKQNTDYYLSFEKEILQYATGIGLVRIFGGSNTNNIIKQIDSTSFKFNTGNNTSIGILFFSSTNGVDVGIIKLSNIMLNEGSSPKPYEKYGEEFCTNKIDETNDKLDGIQGALTDSSSPNLEILGDSAGWLPPGPLDSVLNLPLTMMNNLLTNLGRTCSTLRVELPFVNRNIEIPCVESLMEKMNALILWRWVGRIASVIILYSYLMNLYAWADKILTLRAEFDEAMGVDLANWGRL